MKTKSKKVRLMLAVTLLLSLFAHPGEGDANPANDQACAGAAVTAAAPPANRAAFASPGDSCTALRAGIAPHRQRNPGRRTPAARQAARLRGRCRFGTAGARKRGVPLGIL